MSGRPGRVKGTNMALHLRTPDMAKTPCRKDPYNGIEWTGLHSFLKARKTRRVCPVSEDRAEAMAVEEKACA